MCLPGLLIPSKSEYNCFSSSALWVGQSSARLFNFYVSVLYKNVHLLLPGGEWWQVPCGQTNQNNRLPFSFFFFPPRRGTFILQCLEDLDSHSSYFVCFPSPGSLLLALSHNILLLCLILNQEMPWERKVIDKNSGEYSICLNVLSFSLVPWFVFLCLQTVAWSFWVSYLDIPS